MEIFTRYCMEIFGGGGWLAVCSILVCLAFANTTQHNENAYTRSLELYMSLLLASVKAGVPLLPCKALWTR